MAKKYIPPTTKWQDINPYDSATSLAHIDLLKVRRTLAKRANQRLVRLERASSKITGESYASYGAAEMVKRQLADKGKTRFSESYKFTGDLRSEILQLQGFLNSESSTVQGQRAIELRRISTFEKGEWGSFHQTGVRNRAIKFASNKEFWSFINSGIFADLKRQGFTSEELIEQYDLSREHVSDSETVSKFQAALDEFRSRQSKATVPELRDKLAQGRKLIKPKKDKSEKAKSRREKRRLT